MYSTPAVSLDHRNITAIFKRFEKRFALIANTTFRLSPAGVDTLKIFYFLEMIITFFRQWIATDNFHAGQFIYESVKML